MRAMLLPFAVIAVAAAAPDATVTIDPSQPGALVNSSLLGMNMADWFDPTQAGVAAALRTGGIHASRWPGGSSADEYHWQSNSDCNGGYVNANASFDNFVADVAVPARLDQAVTVNYGSNAACNGGGDPAEAAAWVAYARSHGDRVSTWTVGNEVYGSWEYDLHAAPHDAATYAQAVAGGYYPQMKKADPKAQIGVVVEPNWSPAWDPVVLSQAKYDFVEYHYYAQAPGQESDAYLVGAAAQDFARALGAVKADLAAAGHAATPIYVGELGSVYANPGKQTTSITQALFAGQALGEMMNAGVTRATWWLAFGGCSDSGSGNFGAGLYGWQNFGGYMVFSDGTPEYGCPNATPVPLGTKLPTARAFELFSLVAKSGAHVLTPMLGGSAPALRAYGLTQPGGGAAFVLFNTDETNALTVKAAVAGLNSASAVVVNTYDKAIYDRSKNNVWAGPSQKKLGAQALPLTLTLPTWSMTIVRVSP